MCGIAGFISSSSSTGREEAVQLVQAMTKRLERRGPDSGGSHCFSGPATAVFGHRRLAIIDLSPAGHQPMLTPDGELGVVFNGCIYNFMDLRQELEAAGYQFRSHCDTEVLLHGYRHWGIDGMAQRLRGMFAFAIWDQPRQVLYLVRDRLGVKPLAYAARAGKIAFASTLPALHCAGLTGGLNAEGVLEFLEFGWLSEDQSIYEGARKVPPATIVEWHQGATKERPYWTLPAAGAQPLRFEEAVERTEELILESVRLRLMADVPIAALISAGVDSTLVCWALTKLGANLRSYTVSTPGDPSDEAPEAAATARHLGIAHEVIELPRNEPPDLTQLIDAYPEPFACSSGLGMLKVCRAVKPHATVLLTGDGGDDIYLGYPHYRHFLLAQRMGQRIPGPLARAWNAAAWQPTWPKLLGRGAHLLHYATGGLGAVTSTHNGLPYYGQQGLLGDRLKEQTIASRRIPRSPESGRELLGEFHTYELKTRFVSEYMTKVDGASMHYAIETRAPLLDHRLWECAGSLSHETRLRGGELKAVLRAIARRHVPGVADRRKRGFTIPVERWLVSTWRDQLEALGSGSLLEREGWIRKGALAPAISRALGAAQAPVQLWYLLVLENWLAHNQQ